MEIPCDPCLCNPLSDFSQTQTVVWHHLCLLHNRTIFACKLFIFPSKQVLASIPWGDPKPRVEGLLYMCVVTILTEGQGGNPIFKMKTWGPPEVVVLP